MSAIINCRVAALELTNQLIDETEELVLCREHDNKVELALYGELSAADLRAELEILTRLEMLTDIRGAIESGKGLPVLKEYEQELNTFLDLKYLEIEGAIDVPAMVHRTIREHEFRLDAVRDIRDRLAGHLLTPISRKALADATADEAVAFWKMLDLLQS